MTESTSGPARLPAPIRRSQIGLAARHVFARDGLAARTSDIAKAANITEAVLYRHFRSKDEIYEEAVLRPLEQATSELMRVAMMQAASSDGHTRWELSQEFQRDLLSIVERLTPLAGVALMSEEGRRFYQERVVPLVELAVDSTAQAMSEQEKALIDPRTLLVFMAGMYFGLCLDVMLGSGVVQADRASKELTALVAFGLARPKPRATRGAGSSRAQTADRTSQTSRKPKKGESAPIRRSRGQRPSTA